MLCDTDWAYLSAKSQFLADEVERFGSHDDCLLVVCHKSNITTSDKAS